MTPAEWTGVAGVTIAALGTIGIPCALWLQKVEKTANEAKLGVERIDRERTEALVIWTRRMEKAEDAAESMRELAGAVKHMGELTAAEIKHLAEKVGEHASFAKEQFGEIRHTLKNQDARVQALAQKVLRESKAE